MALRAARIHAWGGDLRVEEIPVPDPAEGEVRVEVLACGVGLTVLNMIRGDLGSAETDLPRVPGHELVGRVVAVGAGVPAERVGELVTSYGYLFCGDCDWCRGAVEPLCTHLAGMLGVNRDGGYAEYVVLPARNAVAIPDGLDPVLATAIPDAITTSVHVCNRAGVRPGDRVVVVGAAGGVGAHTAQMARLWGGEVLGLDVGADKLSFLESELGVAAADSSDFETVVLPSEWAGGADVVVDFVGSSSSMSWALRALGRSGRLVLLTTFLDVDVPVSARELVLKQASVLGSRYASRRELGLAASLVAGGRIRPIVSRVVPLDRVGSIHEDLRRGALIGRGAIVFGG